MSFASRWPLYLTQKLLKRTMYGPKKPELHYCFNAAYSNILNGLVPGVGISQAVDRPTHRLFRW